MADHAMTFEIGPIGSIALVLGALAGFVLLYHFFSWWGRAAGLTRARRIAARLRAPTTSLAEVEDQSSAIEELAQFGDTEAAVRAALELMDEMDETVRSFATEVLRRTRAFDRWTRDLKRGSYRAKLRAIEALGRVGDERAVEQLTEVLGDDDPHVARAASEAVLGRDRDRAVERLADALSSPNRRVAETAAATLVRMGEESVEALVGQLASLNLHARRLSVECLAAVGPPGAVDLLLPLLESEPEAEVRVAIAEGLARCGGERVAAELRRVAKSDPDWFVRGRAYALLAEMNAPDALEFLIDGLAAVEPQIVRRGDSSDAVEVIWDGPRRVRAAIIAGLRALGLTDEEVAAAARSAEQPEPALDGASTDSELADGWAETIAALTESDPARRADAARQLGEAGRSVTAELRRALRDPDPLVRAEAARSLGRAGARDCLDHLAECLRDPDPSVRIASSNAMHAIVAREAAQELRD